MTTHNVWTWDGQNERHVAGPVTHDEAFAVVRQHNADGMRTAEGHRLYIRPADESTRARRAIFRSGDYFQTTASERAGAGPHPESPAKYGVRVHREVPDEVRSAYEVFGADGELDEDGYKVMSSRMRVTPQTELHTGQQHVSGTHIDNSVRRRQGHTPIDASSPYRGVRVYQDTEGKHWLLDGHHTIAVGRQVGRDVIGRVTGKFDMDEVRSWQDEDD